MARLAAALAMVLFAALPAAAPAHEAIGVGSGQAQIIGVSGCGTGTCGDSASGTGLTFSDSVTEVNACGSGGGSQTSATDNSGAAFTVTFDGDVSSSYGSDVNCSSSLDQGRGESTFSRGFTVSSNVAYTIEASRSGSPNAQSSFEGGVALFATSGGSGAPGIVIGAPGSPCCGGTNSVSGVLTAGTYQVQTAVRCVSNPNGTCSGHLDFSLLIGDAAPGVLISEGPSGTTSATTAHFEFDTVTANPPPGVFQCKVDGQPSFSACTSPQDLANLSDGQHTFSVRYDPNGATPPSEAASRTWTVDSTKPTVTFDAAPSGEGNPSNATMSWHAGEQSSFRCSLDGGPAFDCASPHTLLGLAQGPHTFSVSAIDGAGNESTPATVAWSVGDGAPISTACSSGAVAAFGPVRLVARAENACFVEDRIDGENVQVSTGVVSMNGITITPATGTRIVVAPNLGGGSVRVDGPSTLVFGPPPRSGEDPIDFSVGAFELENLGSAATALDRVLDLGGGLLELVPKIKVLPEVGLKLSPDNGGQTVATFKATLPAKAFSAFSDRREKVTLTFAPTLSNDRGVTLAGRIKGGNFFLFGQAVKSIDLGYDQATGAFDGAVAVKIGREGSTSQPVFTAGVTIGATDDTCELRKLSLAASEINRPIGGGVALQRFGGTFQCIGAGSAAALRLTATGGVSLGPRISVGGFNAEALSVDGSAALTLPVEFMSRPFSLAISGTGKVVDVPVSTTTVTYTSPATVRLTGALDLTGGGFGAQLTYGEQGTFVSPTAFNIEAAGTASLLGLTRSANAVLSSVGFAVCVGEPGSRTGFGRAWGGELTAFAVCDVGSFRATPAARAAQAGEQRFAVAAGDRIVVIEARGDIAVAGPSQAEIVKGPSGVSFAILSDPSPGEYVVTGASSAIRVARSLPPLRLRGSVSTRGGTSVLRWRASGLAGQRLELVERAGGSARQLAVTRRSSGRLRFTPDPTFAPRRTIEALAYNGSTPRSRTTIARFTAPKPAKARKVRGLELRGSTLRWRRQRGIRQYELAVTFPNGSTQALRSRRARLKLASLPRTGTVRVAIVAIDAKGDSGPVARAKVR